MPNVREDPQARIIYLWNTETWEYEVATQGTGTGQPVSVENFPATLSGATVPVSGTVLDNINTNLSTLNSLVPSIYNSVLLSYTGDNLTSVVFTLNATTVSTLTLVYDGTKLTSVTKT